jgi:hypothetical protein
MGWPGRGSERLTSMAGQMRSFWKIAVPLCCVAIVGRAAIAWHFVKVGGYPTTAGAYQTTYGGGYSDGFVTKLNPKGSAVVYSTYIGGNNGGGEFASAITVDSGGNAYITGLAGAGFPVTTGAYQTALAGFYAAFVTKLNAAGTALVNSTYVRGDRT